MIHTIVCAPEACATNFSHPHAAHPAGLVATRSYRLSRPDSGRVQILARRYLELYDEIADLDASALCGLTHTQDRPTVSSPDLSTAWNAAGLLADGDPRRA